MKISNNKFILGLGLALVLTSCDFTDFGDTNVNPNATEVPITSALLTNAIAATGNSTVDLDAGLFCQYFSETQYTDDSRYTVQDRAWDGTYAGSMNDLQNIINYNTDPKTKDVVSVNGSNNNQIAVAKILLAYRYSILTDTYGDIPYTAALKGEAQVPYDAQADVYKGLFKDMKEAIAQFDNGLSAQGDVLFNGNITRWKKFANSLRLILAIRISKADANLGKTEFNAALAASGGVIESNADNATLTYPGGSFRSPWYEVYNGRKDYSISDIMVSQLTTLKDPRLPVFGAPNASGGVKGVPYGLPRDQAIAFTNANPDWSFILAPNKRTESSSVHIITVADTYFARAEAAQLGWTSENAETMYNNGIKASLEQWGLGADYSKYIADPAIAFSGAGDKLTKIRLQTWISFYPKGLQGWSNWRRTGVPNLQPTPFAVNTSKQIPRRFAYPSTEQNLNKAAWQSATSKLGGDDPDKRVWWDK
jgi:hypothetical protein